ncbi:MAG: hypothetical protein ACLP9L_08065 [Thermoguttaceae bacterium]
MKKAGLVEHAQEWRWSGMSRRAQGQAGDDGLVLSPWPVARPRNWTTRVNARFDEAQLESVRKCVDRGGPLGSERWVIGTARRLGLDFTLRGPGRPRKQENQGCSNAMPFWHFFDSGT